MPSWLIGTAPVASAVSRSRTAWDCSQIRPAQGSVIVAIASSTGRSTAGTWPLPLSITVVARRRNEQRRQVRANHSSPSLPQLVQVKEVAMPAQSTHTGSPLAPTPGNARSISQPAQRPRRRTARRAQLTQT